MQEKLEKVMSCQLQDHEIMGCFGIVFSTSHFYFRLALHTIELQGLAQQCNSIWCIKHWHTALAVLIDWAVGCWQTAGYPPERCRKFVKCASICRLQLTGKHGPRARLTLAPRTAGLNGPYGISAGLEGTHIQASYLYPPSFWRRLKTKMSLSFGIGRSMLFVTLNLKKK